MFGSIGISGPVWGCLGLELSQTRHVQNVVAPNCRGLSLCCPLRNFHSWVGLQSEYCLPPPHPWGHSLTGVCSSLSLSQGPECLWTGADPCWGCMHTARYVASHWVGSGQELLEGVDLQHGGGWVSSVCKVCAQVHWRSRPAAQGLRQAWLEGVDPLKYSGGGRSSVSRLGTWFLQVPVFFCCGEGEGNDTC